MQIVETDTYKKLIADDGYKLTTYQDNEPIEDFFAVKVACLPLNADISRYREITEDIAEELENKKEKEFRNNNG